MNFSDKNKMMTTWAISMAIIVCNNLALAQDSQEWSGKWFPKKPGDDDGTMGEAYKMSNSIDNHQQIIHSNPKKTMGISDPQCDDAQKNLWRDYDPDDVSHHRVFLCTRDRGAFEPNITTQPILTEYVIPPEYSALHRCMNESITYDYTLPTFGTHRSLWATYGKYEYIPPQRWIHNLEHGAIVALYHPCVNQRQLQALEELTKNCLYRHIISPYKKLKPDRPFALIAWGKSLEMSYVDKEVVIGFIRLNALQGPETTSRDGLYHGGLLEKAKVVSNIDDTNLCPFM